MTRANGLREFLRSRRAAISPESVGLPESQTARRSQGLRREEVAVLAGVSVDYYTKLEQERFGVVSEQVLNAIADALRLDRLEREHLRSLTSPRVRSRRPSAPRTATMRVRASIRAMIESMSATPAIVQDRCMNVLAANRAANILLTDFDARTPAERNTARWVFLDSSSRVRFPHWGEIAATTVAVLRASRDPQRVDEDLERLIEELSMKSADFAQRWTDYQLFRYESGKKQFFHETVGKLTLNYDTLEIPDTDGQTLCVYNADVGSPSEEKLQLLLSWNAAPVIGN